MKKNPFSLTDRPLKPSSRKLGKEITQTAVVTAQPTGRESGWNVSDWKFVLWTCHGVSPDVNDAGAVGFTAKVRIWRYKEFACQGTDTPSGTWFAAEENTVSLDGDIENGGPMEGEIATDGSEKIYLQVVEVSGAPQSWEIALCIYGLADRDSECCEAGATGGGGSSSLPTVTATHDEAVKDKGLQIMFDARSAQATAVDTGDAARPIVNLYGEQVIAGYDWNTASISVTEADPLNEKVVIDEIVNNTSVSADPGATYAPSADGIPMLGFKDLSAQLYLVGGVGAAAANRTVTTTTEATDDLSDGAAVRWPDITPAGYDLTTNTTGNASYTATGATAVDYIVDFDELNVKRWRLKYDWDADPSVTDGEIGVRVRRKAL